MNDINLDNKEFDNESLNVNDTDNTKSTKSFKVLDYLFDDLDSDFDNNDDNDKLNQTNTTQDTDQTNTFIINDNKTTSNKTTISINTDYSKLTDDILIKHTNHS